MSRRPENTNTRSRGEDVEVTDRKRKTRGLPQSLSGLKRVEAAADVQESNKRRKGFALVSGRDADQGARVSARPAIPQFSTLDAKKARTARWLSNPDAVRRELECYARHLNIARTELKEAEDDRTVKIESYLKLRSILMVEISSLEAEESAADASNRELQARLMEEVGAADEKFDMEKVLGVLQERFSDGPAPAEPVAAAAPSKGKKSAAASAATAGNGTLARGSARGGSPGCLDADKLLQLVEAAATAAVDGRNGSVTGSAGGKGASSGIVARSPEGAGAVRYRWLDLDALKPSQSLEEEAAALAAILETEAQTRKKVVAVEASQRESQARLREARRAMARGADRMVETRVRMAALKEEHIRKMAAYEDDDSNTSG
ncbi:unnamed protein product [Phaeothamnion confervicola]